MAGNWICMMLYVLGCLCRALPVCAKQDSVSFPLVLSHHEQKQTCPHKQPWEGGSEKRFALMMSLFFFLELLPSICQESAS